MARFHRWIIRFAEFPCPRALRWLPLFAALAAMAAPDAAEAGPKGGKALRAYDGTWNVVFATTRGNCSSGYSVPFTVMGSRVLSAGGGRVSGSVNRAGAVAVNRLLAADLKPACQRRRRMAWHHHGRPLQRHLAGHAELVRIPHLREMKTARLSDGPLHI